jgi:hypothetical protein
MASPVPHSDDDTLDLTGNALATLAERRGAWLAAQRSPIGELPGRIRDLENNLPEDGIQRTITENHTLRARVRQLTQDNRRPEERLAGARDTSRFPGNSIAGLEASLLAATPRGQQEAPQCT